MRVIILILLLSGVAYANECIVDQDNYVREWTAGRFIAPPLLPGERVEPFLHNFAGEDYRIKLINNNLINTSEPVDKVDKEEEKLLELLDRDRIKNKIKEIR